MDLHNFRTSNPCENNAVLVTYPDGRTRLVASTVPFRSPGWEPEQPGHVQRKKAGQGTDPRAVYRAKSHIRDYVLSNQWDFWVTLTIAPDADGSSIRYDYAEQQRRMAPTLDNLVRRRGVAYLLIPEYHRDGAIHYHGFVRGMRYRWSGTMQPPDGGKPRRVKRAERADLAAAGWHDVYNLPEWTHGFSTAIRLYGDPMHAAAYACKYAEKQMDGERIGGRIYLHGGDLRQPDKVNLWIDPAEVEAMPDAYRMPSPVGSGVMAVKWTAPDKVLAEP